MPKDARCGIDRLEVRESVKGGRRVRTSKMITLADKMAALEALGKHLGMFPKPPKAGK